MATITNKSSAALSISLPGGKKLRLGPFKSAEISAKAIDHPQVQKLVEAGDVEIEGQTQKPAHAKSAGKGGGRSSGGSGHGAGIRRTGDR